jgi:hypothetical protein
MDEVLHESDGTFRTLELANTKRGLRVNDEGVHRNRRPLSGRLYRHAGATSLSARAILRLDHRGPAGPPNGGDDGKRSPHSFDHRSRSCPFVPPKSRRRKNRPLPAFTVSGMRFGWNGPSGPGLAPPRPKLARNRTANRRSTGARHPHAVELLGRRLAPQPMFEAGRVSDGARKRGADGRLGSADKQCPARPSDRGVHQFPGQDSGARAGE